LTPAALAKGWIRYYRNIRRIADRVPVVDFERVVKDPAGVIAECNDWYGTSFQPYFPTAESQGMVWAEVESLSKRLRIRLSRIGSITRGRTLLVLDEQGERVKLRGGFDHFA